LCGSIFCAIAVWLLYRIALGFLTARQAILLALLFAFGMPVWANASRNLGQHGPSILCLSLALYFVAAARARASRFGLGRRPLGRSALGCGVYGAAFQWHWGGGADVFRSCALPPMAAAVPGLRRPGGGSVLHLQSAGTAQSVSSVLRPQCAQSFSAAGRLNDE